MGNKKILITGGAGLIGQNLVHELERSDYKNIVVIDKNKTNLEILRNLNPNVKAICADLSSDGNWYLELPDTDLVIQCHA